MTTNGDKPTPFLEKLEGFARTIVRPTVTLALVAVASLMVLRALEVAQWYQTLVVGIVSYWFASRQKQ